MSDSKNTKITTNPHPLLISKPNSKNSETVSTKPSLKLPLTIHVTPSNIHQRNIQKRNLSDKADTTNTPATKKAKIEEHTKIETKSEKTKTETAPAKSEVGHSTEDPSFDKISIIAQIADLENIKSLYYSYGVSESSKEIVQIEEKIKQLEETVNNSEAENSTKDPSSDKISIAAQIADLENIKSLYYSCGASESSKEVAQIEEKIKQLKEPVNNSEAENSTEDPSFDKISIIAQIADLENIKSLYYSYGVSESSKEIVQIEEKIKQLEKAKSALQSKK